MLKIIPVDDAVLAVQEQRTLHSDVPSPQPLQTKAKPSKKGKPQFFKPQEAELEKPTGLPLLNFDEEGYRVEGGGYRVDQAAF